MAQLRPESSGTFDSARLYSAGQRAFALFWGALCHGTFLIAISAMAAGLFTGMRLGRGTLEGGTAVFANLALLIQFAVPHSILLSAKGRRWMSRFPLFGIGSELSTTTFALFSSLQILTVFLLWSPGETLWFAPTGAALLVWTLVYACAWLLLLKAMADSGLSLQTGSLGWMAVWQNRHPEFPGYAMRGLYRFSRQPIYVAFALILWTAPTWTPDHLMVAVLWTGYCLIGPVFKERRFLQFYGDGYRNFAHSVPYWLPFSRQSRPPQTETTGSSASGPATDFDIVIAGAGPIGMVLANLLGKEGHQVLVVEPREQRSHQSRAIGVTAPTLQTLERIGILDSGLQASIPINDAKVYADDGEAVGSLCFHRIDGSPPPVVSLPQCELEGLLETAMHSCCSVTYRTGARIASHRNEADRVAVEIKDPAGEKSQHVSARWLVACDGANSLLRDQLRMPSRRKTYGCEFAMADFDDHSDFGDEVRLFFTADGAVETFPLPDGKRRWVVQLTHPKLISLDDDTLLKTVACRARYSPRKGERRTPWSHFVPQRLLCDRFFHGRTLLCGDAAHVMSPIGGHGMNVGIGDAIAAFTCLQQLLSTAESDPLQLLRTYDRQRRKAFVRASRRAALGMWLGSRTGKRFSLFRARLLKQFLSSRSLRQSIADHYAMIADLKLQNSVAAEAAPPPSPERLNPSSL